MNFWYFLDKLVKKHKIIIDRPKGTAHPRYPNFIYPLDYGYLKNTTAVDNSGIDIFVGSSRKKQVRGILASVDLNKNDTEIKILYACTKNEMLIAQKSLNIKFMRTKLTIRS